MGKIKLKETQKAYLAGLIDGEGYIFFRKDKSNSKWYGGISITITDRGIVETLLKWLGGRNYSWKYGVETKNHKKRYRWEIGMTEAEFVLSQISGYLIIKKKNAELFLKFRETFKNLKIGRGIKVSNEIDKKRIKLVEKLRKITGRKNIKYTGSYPLSDGK